MSRQLSRKPTVHDSAVLNDAELGAYTEVGAMSYLEQTSFDDYSYCGQFCFFQNTRIGKFSNIAAMVRVGPTKHPIERPTLHHFTYRRHLYGFDDHDDVGFFDWRADQIAAIGHDTWLGHGSIIMPGVSIGIGSVVGAGAVVTHDIPPYSVAVGVPARVVKRRFPPDVAEALLSISWWDWPHEVIKERLSDFTGTVESFVRRYGNHCATGSHA